MGRTIQCYEHETNSYGPHHDKCSGVQWRSPRTTVVIYCNCWCHKEDNDAKGGKPQTHKGSYT